MNVSFVQEQDLLDLSFEGNLDLTVTHAVFGIVPQIQDELKTCIMDLTQVDRVFDSGIALLRMLSRNLHQMGATVVVVGTHPDLRLHLSLIQGDAAYPSRGHLAAAMATA
jgi:anti-anti-sigma regulatory factor